MPFYHRSQGYNYPSSYWNHKHSSYSWNFSHPYLYIFITMSLILLSKISNHLLLYHSQTLFKIKQVLQLSLTGEHSTPQAPANLFSTLRVGWVTLSKYIFDYPHHPLPTSPSYFTLTTKTICVYPFVLQIKTNILKRVYTELNWKLFQCCVLPSIQPFSPF